MLAGSLARGGQHEAASSALGLSRTEVNSDGAKRARA
jgi:hypothetical protein